MKTAKYAVCPGPVRSKVDGQVHHLTAVQLMQLYKVNPDDCVIIGANATPEFIRMRVTSWTVWLTPRYDGDYRLPN